MDSAAFTPVVDTLERTPGIVMPLVREMPGGLRRRRPRPEKWSAHEHACHLTSVHPLFFQRLDRMLGEDHPTLQPYLPEKDDPEGEALHGDLEEALDRFARDRAALVDRFRSLKPGDWDRTAEHPEYSHYSVFIMARHIALHDLLHAYRIEELVLKKDWDATS